MSRQPGIELVILLDRTISALSYSIDLRLLKCGAHRVAVLCVVEALVGRLD